MVERLKDAIIKARQQRQASDAELPPAAQPAAVAPPPGEEASTQLREAMVTAVGKGPSAPVANRQRAPLAEEWAALPELQLKPSRLDHHRIVSYSKNNPAHVAFDILRTRILNILRTNGWSRLAITSPTKNCGKSMVATNLAMSLGHQSDLRSMLLDVDMRAPSIARYLDVNERIVMADFMEGRIDPADFLRRIGPNLAIGLNTEAMQGPAEMFLHERTVGVLAATLARYKPNVVIYDLPPMLVSDDVLAFLPHVDCVLLVAASGETTPKEIMEAEQLLGDQTNFLGVMLNKSKERTDHNYYYKAGV